MCVCASAEVPTFSQQDWRRARKQHQCDECKRTIEVHERYRYEVWGYTTSHGKAEINNYKHCAQCYHDWEALQEAEFSATNDSCAQYGYLRECIEEAVAEGWLEENNDLAKRWLPAKMEPNTPAFRQMLEQEGQQCLPL